MAVAEVDVRRREPYPFDYERIGGVIRFAVDPRHAANRAIVDLDRAPRDERGRVTFEADFTFLRPSDSARSNRRLLFYVVNRGRQQLRLNNAPAEDVPTDRLDPGDGFLMRHGWTVAMCGWQWDVVRQPALLGLEAPQALGGDGQPVAGQVLVQIQPNEPYRHQLLAHWPLHPPPGIEHLQHRPYPAADVDDPDATLTVREWAYGERRTIPRARWRFARDEDGRPVADDRYVWLEEGFEPGKIYDVVYRTRICPVVGTGLLAVRDCVAHLRGDGMLGPIEHTYGWGVSQCGRFLRSFLLDGLNVDEDGRQVFDGLIPQVAGARRGEFNQRYGQPSAQHALGFGHLPPFTTERLLHRQRELGGVPRVFEINTSSEYWRIDCSLIHTDPEGLHDVEPPPEARTYLMAGTQHGPGTVPPHDTTPAGARGANCFNVVDYYPLMRAALVNLDRWVSDGVAPPPSAFPRLADGTAVRRDDVLETCSRFPGIALPDPGRLPTLRRIDLGPDANRGVGHYPPKVDAPYPSFVSAVDADGNELAGLRLPDLTSPVGTHTGWVPRHPTQGGEGQIVDMMGTTAAFPRRGEDRRRTGDPRAAIDERYPDRAAYIECVSADAAALAANRHVLAEDVDLIVRLAAERYDSLSSS
jgi:hypothetical protein